MHARRSTRPTPTPKTDVARRLEDVRTLSGLPSLRSFWSKLVDGQAVAERVSYEAARNYHFDRDPPASYLVRVSQVFGVSLEWLLTGKGEVARPTYYESVFRAQGRMARQRARRLLGALDEGAYRSWARRWKHEPTPGETINTLPVYSEGSVSLALLAELLHFRIRARHDAGRPASEERELELAREIGAAIVAPLDALGINYRGNTVGRLFLYEHVQAMVPVLFRSLALDDPPWDGITTIAAMDRRGDGSSRSSSPRKKEAKDAKS